MADNLTFKVGKVYIGEWRHHSSGHVLGTGLFLCTKRTYRNTRSSTDNYVSLHEVYSRPDVDLHWPTRVCQVCVRSNCESVDNAGLDGEYSVYAKDVYNGKWYEPKATVCHVYHPRSGVAIADYMIPFESMADAKRYAISIYDKVAIKGNLSSRALKIPLDVGYPTKAIKIYGKDDISPKLLGYVVKSSSGNYFWIADKKNMTASKIRM